MSLAVSSYAHMLPLPMLLASKQGKTKSREVEFQAVPIEEFQEVARDSNINGQEAEACANPKSSSRELKVNVDPVEESEHHVVDNPQGLIAFLGLLVKESALMGISTWGSMPITFFLAWKGYRLWLYMFVFVKFLTLSAIQVIVGKRVDGAFRAHMPDSPEVRALDRRSSSIWLSSGSALQNVSRVLLALGAALSDVTEALDPDTDAMTPGNAKRNLSTDDNQQFSLSWNTVPLIGSLIARVGLSCMLALSLTAISLWQVYLFSDQFFKLTAQISKLDPSPAQLTGRIHTVYGNLYHMTDLAGLCLMRSQMHCLWMSRDQKLAEIGGDRFISYKARVPEMVCQGWFTVTTLALSSDGPFQATCDIWFSVFTTLATSLKAFFEMASIFLPWSRFVLSKSWGAWLPYKLLAYMVFHLLGFLALCVRLIGILLCESHDFHLSTMQCRH